MHSPLEDSSCIIVKDDVLLKDLALLSSRGTLLGRSLFSFLFSPRFFPALFGTTLPSSCCVGMDVRSVTSPRGSRSSECKSRFPHLQSLPCTSALAFSSPFSSIGSLLFLLCCLAVEDLLEKAFAPLAPLLHEDSSAAILQHHSLAHSQLLSGLLCSYVLGSSSDWRLPSCLSL